MAPTKAKKSAKPKAPKAKKSNPKADKAAKVKSATKGTKPIQAPPQPEDTKKLPGKTFIKELARQVLLAQEESASAGGEAGALISNAVKNKGLNAKVFRDALRLRKMGLSNPLKLRVYLDDMVYMAECLELEKLAGDQLFDPRAGAQEIESESADEPDSETVDGDDNDPDNVHQLHRDTEAA